MGADVVFLSIDDLVVLDGDVWSRNDAEGLG